jgi:hypothetical protein
MRKSLAIVSMDEVETILKSPAIVLMDEVGTYLNLLP